MRAAQESAGLGPVENREGGIHIETATANSARRAPIASREFFQKTLDSLRAHIAILEGDGSIVAVNAAWDHFARSNGLMEQFCGPGANYLRACDRATGECSEEAGRVADGIRDVVAGRVEDFYLEYPCHSPSEQRWFSVRVTRFAIDGETRVVVTRPPASPLPSKVPLLLVPHPR